MSGRSLEFCCCYSAQQHCTSTTVCTNPIISYFSLQFDPAIQRFSAMRATNFDHFRVTPKTTWLGFMFVVLPVGLMTYLTLREKVTPTGCLSDLFDCHYIISSMPSHLLRYNAQFNLWFSVLMSIKNVSPCNEQS